MLDYNKILRNEDFTDSLLKVEQSENRVDIFGNKKGLLYLVCMLAKFVEEDCQECDLAEINFDSGIDTTNDSAHLCVFFVTKNEQQRKTIKLIVRNSNIYIVGKNMIDNFLQCEIDNKEMTEGILHFINSVHIRNGEFECNLHVIKKIDLSTFVIYQEYEDSDGKKSIGLPIFGIFRNDFQRQILEFAKSKGISISKECIKD